eukprot:5935628-Amphidinium_carterae.1
MVAACATRKQKQCTFTPRPRVVPVILLFTFGSLNSPRAVGANFVSGTRVEFFFVGLRAVVFEPLGQTRKFLVDAYGCCYLRVAFGRRNLWVCESPLRIATCGSPCDA